MKNFKKNNNGGLRTSQLKIFSQYVENNYKDEFLDENGKKIPHLKKDLVLQELQNNISENNKPLQKYVDNFLTSYLDNLKKKRNRSNMGKSF